MTSDAVLLRTLSGMARDGQRPSISPKRAEMLTRAADEIDRLRRGCEGAVKWLLSRDPANRVHALNVLLIALAVTEQEFFATFRDEIILHETPSQPNIPECVEDVVR